MSRYRKFLFIGMVLILTFNGCEINEDLTESIDSGEFNGTFEPNPPSSPPNPPKPPIKPIDKKFYGYWVYVEDGSYEKIDKDFAYEIKPFGDNLIKIERDSKEYTLLRKGSNDASISGQVYNDVTQLEKFSNEKQKKLTYYVPSFQKGESNNLYITVHDGFNKYTQKVNSDGSFHVSGIQWFGDYSSTKNNNVMSKSISSYYKEDDDMLGNCRTAKKRCDNEGNLTLVSVNEKNETRVIHYEDNVSLPDKDTNLGNYYIGDKENEYNFKTTQVINSKDKDDRYMYENRTYKGILIFKNTGNKIANGLNYTISTDDHQYVEKLTDESTDNLGSIESNQSQEIPFEITFGRLGKIKHKVKLDFIIRDAYGKEWLDNVYLDVYQTPITVNIKSKSSKLKGYFITPEHDILNIDTKDIEVKLPRRPDGKYFFVVSKPSSIDEETGYSIGIDVDAPNFEGYKDTSAYEPNDNEATATKLEIGSNIRAFVHKNDIDFYTIDFKSDISFTPPSLPFK